MFWKNSAGFASLMSQQYEMIAKEVNTTLRAALGEEQCLGLSKWSALVQILFSLLGTIFYNSEGKHENVSHEDNLKELGLFNLEIQRGHNSCLHVFERLSCERGINVEQ